MKLSLWIYTAAVTVAVLAIDLLNGFLANILHGVFGNKPLPAITNVWMSNRWCCLFLPILFFVISIFLSRGGAATTSQCLVFGAVVTFVIICLIGATALAFAAPFTFIGAH